MGTPLSPSFYLKEDVVAIAKSLLGKALFTSFNGTLTGGIITETEAYRGPEDKASHAYQNRCTPRNKVMFEKGGISYVYMCYGIHALFNVVTNVESIPHAILIRALYPTHGLDVMKQRRKKEKNLCLGPGSVCQALGITKEHSGLSLLEQPVWIEDRGIIVPEKKISCTPRIGIDYAGEDASLPWRFIIDY